MRHLLATTVATLLDRARHLGYLAGMPPVGRLRLDGSWWDRSYQAGKNERYVADDGEWERLAITAALAMHGRCGATVLDVGCGTGRMLDHVRIYGAQRYIGVDFSAVALGAARSREQMRVRPSDVNARGRQVGPHSVAVSWIHADLQVWQPNEPFDVMLMSEVTYYLAGHADVLERLLGALRPGGVAVVSMWEDRRRWRQWRAITRAMCRAGAQPEATVTVRLGALSWKIRRYGIPD
jgi:trans-aconitate methyltransferase